MISLPSDTLLSSKNDKSVQQKTARLFQLIEKEYAEPVTRKEEVFVIPNLFIEYKLITDTEYFKIEHHCAFINENMTRIIPLQDNSSLNIEMISSEFSKTDTRTKKK